MGISNEKVASVLRKVADYCEEMEQKYEEACRKIKEENQTKVAERSRELTKDLQAKGVDVDENTVRDVVKKDDKTAEIIEKVAEAGDQDEEVTSLGSSSSRSAKEDMISEASADEAEELLLRFALSGETNY